jgi:hypothetical protein
MIRLYKFRGKNLENGEWVYGSLIMKSYDDVLIVNSDGDFQVDPDTVGMMLFKWRRREFYDGDIVKYQSRDESGPYVYVSAWRYASTDVTHTDGYIQHDGKERFYVDGPATFNLQNCEVIGNVYDNKELYEEIS